MKIKNDSLFSIKVSSKGKEGIIVKPNHEVDIHECDQVSITNVIGKKTFITCGINGGSEVDVTYNGRNSLVLYSVVGFVILEWVLYYFKIPTINEFVATTILGYLIILIISIVYPCYSFINKSSFAERDNKTKNLGDVFFLFYIIDNTVWIHFYERFWGKLLCIIWKCCDAISYSTDVLFFLCAKEN